MICEVNRSNSGDVIHWKLHQRSGIFLLLQKKKYLGKNGKEYFAYLTPGDDATSYPPSIYSFTTNMAKTLRKVGPQFNLRLFLSTHSTPPHR